MANAVTIGRGNDNDIVLPHPFLSSKHAEISLVDRQSMTFRIKDMDTTNGTFKNGERIKEAEFKLSDTISLGSCTLEPALYLPRFYTQDSDNQSEKSVKAPTTSGSPLWSKITIVVLASLLLASIYYMITGSGIGDDLKLDGKIILQFIGIWMVLMLVTQLSISVKRYQRQVSSEKYFRDLMFEQWNTKATALLKSQESNKDLDQNTWEGFRKFEIGKKVKENEGITSIYLVPHDKTKLPVFKPGQYLTFKLDIPGQNQPKIRCYSLSDRYHENYYRVSIKKIPPPRDKPDVPWGLSSSFFHDQLKVGDIVDVKAPSGKFFLDSESNMGVVLIAGGVGLTPMISMLNTLIKAGSNREIWFFYGVRNGKELAMGAHLRSIAQAHDNVKLNLCFSNPDESDKKDVDFQHSARVSVELFKQLLPSSNYQYYLCGPPPLMQGVTGDLKTWGVPDSDVYAEAFGPASIKPKKAAQEKVSESIVKQEFEINFAKSNKKLHWKPGDGPLLTFAAANGLILESGCGMGNCGTCAVAIRDGEVEYTSDHDAEPESGSCLVCVSEPKSNMTIDA